jgi:hypothetical protein
LVLAEGVFTALMMGCASGRYDQSNEQLAHGLNMTSDHFIGEMANVDVVNPPQKIYRLCEIQI